MSEETSPGGLSLPRDVAQRIESDPSLLGENMPRPVVDDERREEPKRLNSDAAAPPDEPSVLFAVKDDRETGTTQIRIPGEELATEAFARTTDPGTSWAAARSIPENELRQSQSAVLALLREIGPATDETIAERYKTRRLEVDWPLQSPSGLRTRRHELAEAGYVEDTGRREMLPSHRWSIIWQASS